MSNHLNKATILKHWRQIVAGKERHQNKLLQRRFNFEIRRAEIEKQVARDLKVFLLVVIIWCLGFLTGVAMIQGFIF